MTIYYLSPIVVDYDKRFINNSKRIQKLVTHNFIKF